MNTKSFALLILTVFGAINCFSQSPRLFITNDKLLRLKEAILVENSHHQQLLEQIKARVDENDLSIYGSDRSNYNRSYQAVENALIYLITEDTTYAGKAWHILSEMYTSMDEGTPTIPDLGNYETKTPGSKALTYAFPGMAYAICYDWARQGWNSDQTKFVRDSIMEGLNDWEKLFRWELYNMPNSNWVSVCRSTELVMMLAVEEEENRADRFDTVKYLLDKHYNMAYGPTGYSNEGIAYTHYGVPFGFAALYALQSIGDTTLNESFNKEWWKLMMYTFSYSAEKLHLMTSVDSHYSPGEGLFGLLFGYLDIPDLPYYKDFYDHLLGIDSQLDNSNRFDQRRLGAVWNFIYYPETVEAKNPTESFEKLYFDLEYGSFFFRSSWQGENDILFNIMAKSMYHSKGWQDAETFNIGLVGHGNRYFGQSGKSHELEDYSSLLVDNKSSASLKDIGRIDSYETDSAGGYIVIDGGTKYANLGISNSKRHVLVHFANEGMAIISTLDLLQSSSSHNYKWQLNTGNEDSDGNLMVTTGTENGLPYFLFEGKTKGYLKGWSINHSDLQFEGTDPCFLEIRNSGNEEIWNVMCTGTGTPPSIEFEGNGMNRKIYIDDYELFYDSINTQIRLGQKSSPSTGTLIHEEVQFESNPNPVANELNLKPDIAINDVTLTLVDFSGRAFLKEYLPVLNKNGHSIRFDNIRSGVYYLRLKSQYHNFSKKIIVL